MDITLLFIFYYSFFHSFNQTHKLISKAQIQTGPHHFLPIPQYLSVLLLACFASALAPWVNVRYNLQPQANEKIHNWAIYTFLKLVCQASKTKNKDEQEVQPWGSENISLHVNYMFNHI